MKELLEKEELFLTGNIENDEELFKKIIKEDKVEVLRLK